MMEESLPTKKASEHNAKKITRLSLKQKIELLQCYSEGTTINHLMNQFNISRQAVHYIIKKRDEILETEKCLKTQHGNFNKVNISGVEKSVFEQALYLWFLQKRSIGEPVSGPLLKEKARVLNAKLGGPSAFVASDGWLGKFKARHGIRDVKTKGEKLSNNFSSSTEFLPTLTDFVKEKGLSWDRVYNADETGLGYRALPTRTLATAEEKEVFGRKIAKDRLTVLTCTNATGSHKLPLLVIGKYQKPRCFKNIDMTTLPVHYRAHSSAWMSRAIFTDWFTNIFLPDVKARGQPGDKYLLLLDNAPSHPPVEELSAIDLDCYIMYLPPNTTAHIQPMDQGIISTLKHYYRTDLLRHLLFEDNTSPGHTDDFVKRWSILDCCNSLGKAWLSVSDATARNCWNKLRCPEEAHEVEKDIVPIQNMANQMSPDIQFSPTDIKTWLSGDDWYPTFYVRSDDEIIKYGYDEIPTEAPMMEEPGHESIDEDSPTCLEAAEACKCLDRWLKANPVGDNRFLYNVNELRCLISSRFLQSGQS